MGPNSGDGLETQVELRLLKTTWIIISHAMQRKGRFEFSFIPPKVPVLTISNAPSHPILKRQAGQ